MVFETVARHPHFARAANAATNNGSAHVCAVLADAQAKRANPRADTLTAAAHAKETDPSMSLVDMNDLIQYASVCETIRTEAELCLKLSASADRAERAASQCRAWRAVEPVIPAHLIAGAQSASTRP